MWKSTSGPVSGPIAVDDLRASNPHESCQGKDCRRTVQDATEDLWYLIRGKTNCPECYKKKEAKRAREAAKEVVAADFVEEISGGLITDDTRGPRLAKLLWKDSPDQMDPPPELTINRPEKK